MQAEGHSVVLALWTWGLRCIESRYMMVFYVDLSIFLLLLLIVGLVRQGWQGLVFQVSSTRILARAMVIVVRWG